MKYHFLFLLAFIFSFNSFAAMKTAKDQDLPAFEGLKSNDSLQVEKYLEKKGFHKSAPYKIELYCEQKASGKKKFLGKSNAHVCVYRKIEGYAGNDGHRDSDKTKP